MRVKLKIGQKGDVRSLAGVRAALEGMVGGFLPATVAAILGALTGQEASIRTAAVIAIESLAIQAACLALWSWTIGAIPQFSFKIQRRGAVGFKV